MYKGRLALIIKRPFSRLFLLLFTSVSLFAGFFYLKYRPPYAFYDTLARAERIESEKLLQKTNARDLKFVKFRQLQGAGFNNQAQEVLLYHHLALLSSRVYVYLPFVWRPREQWLPLSSFLLGPTKGTITYEVFKETCLPEQIKHVSFGNDPNVWNKAIDLLRGSERCIVVDDWVLNWRYLATSYIHPIWPSFREYLARHFEWPSNILVMVNRAYDKLNLHSQSNSGGEPYLAIHFRRGDFEEHCSSLANRKEGFTTWSTLPLLQNSVYAPPVNPNNETSVMEHCYPSLRRILGALDSQIRHRPHIRAVYFLHDGAWDHPLVYLQFYKLATALQDKERARRVGWSGSIETVTHSGDLPVHWGERDWKVAVDIELGRNADVFIGNGYSSLTSQIIALRLADGGEPSEITLL